MSAGGHVLVLRCGRQFRGTKDGTRVVSEEEASRRIFPAVGYAAQAVTPGLASNVATVCVPQDLLFGRPPTEPNGDLIFREL